MISCLTHPILDSSQGDQRSGVIWENPRKEEKKMFCNQNVGIDNDGDDDDGGDE